MSNSDPLTGYLMIPLENSWEGVYYLNMDKSYFSNTPTELVELFATVARFLRRDARIGEVRRAYRRVVKAATSR